MTVTKQAKIAVPVVLERAALAKVLAVVMGAVDRHATIPVLGNVALRHEKGVLTIAGTNLDQVLTVDVDTGGGDDFATTVNAGRLAALVKAMTSPEVALSISDKGKLVVAGGGSDAVLHTIAHDDFPAAHGVPEVISSIDPVRFAADLAFVMPAVSTDETRYYLNGVCLWPRGGDDEDLAVVASDDHRLHMVSMPRIPAVCDLPRPPILPTRFCAMMRQLIAANAGEATADFGLTNGKAVFRIGRWQLTSKLIDGTFPDWSRVVPAPGGVEVTVLAKALTDAVGTVAAITSEKVSAVTLTHDDGALVTSCVSPEHGEARARVRGGTVPAFDFRIGFNHKYLTQVMRIFAGADVAAQFIDPAAPVIWRCPDVPGRLVVLMPMMV
jgi:DNA polymerase-3 subunit beta